MSQDTRFALAIAATTAVYIAMGAASVWWIDRMLPAWLQYISYAVILPGGIFSWHLIFNRVADGFGVK